MVEFKFFPPQVRQIHVDQDLGAAESFNFMEQLMVSHKFYSCNILPDLRWLSFWGVTRVGWLVGMSSGKLVRSSGLRADREGEFQGKHKICIKSLQVSTSDDERLGDGKRLY